MSTCQGVGGSGLASESDEEVPNSGSQFTTFNENCCLYEVLTQMQLPNEHS